MNLNIKNNPKRYFNPYFSGVLLGLVLLATFYITGRGLGASGAVKTGVATAVEAVAPQNADDTGYLSQFVSDDVHPLNDWLVFEVIGVFFGAILSGAFAGRLRWKVEHSPKITSKTRLIMAVLGGIFFGFGSQLGRGCTSGAALSGMATMATAGFVTMLAIFGSAYIFAYFFRKFWI